MKYETTELMKKVELLLFENYSEHNGCENGCPHKEDDSFAYMAANILEAVAENISDALRGLVR